MGYHPDWNALPNAGNYSVPSDWALGLARALGTEGRFFIDPEGQVNFVGSHRSGWPDALMALAPLHGDDGVRLDGFLERAFAWQLDSQLEAGQVPYRSPWVGFLHNPPMVPEWHDVECAPATLLSLPSFRASLPHCKGVFVLSEYLAKWLREKVDVPVDVVRHPSHREVPQFSLDKYRTNPTRRVIQVGWWLRRLHSIAELPVRTLRRTTIEPRNEHYPVTLEREQRVLGLHDCDWSHVERWGYLTAGDYDRVLTENLAFCHLYDASANNLVVECIARATPLLVNRLPAVEEYLGSDYPLYFDDLAEAASKAESLACIAEAHEYLVALEKGWLDGSTFRQAIEASRIYRSLPAGRADAA